MPLSAEDKQFAQQTAKELCSDSPATYMRLHELMRTHSPQEADFIMAVIFNLLPQSAKDHVAVELMTEAMNAHKK